jgi:hypothetical protein
MKKLLLFVLIVLGNFSLAIAQNDVAASKGKTGEQMISLIELADGQKMKIITDDLNEADNFGKWSVTYDSRRKAFSFSNGISTVTSIVQVEPNFLLLPDLFTNITKVLQYTADPELALVRRNLQDLQVISNIELQENVLKFYNDQELILVTKFVKK